MRKLAQIRRVKVRKTFFGQPVLHDRSGRIIDPVKNRHDGGDGVDRHLETSDDRVWHRETFAYDANHNQTEYVYDKGAGQDGVWGTTDDWGWYRIGIIYDVNGYPAEVIWSEPGNDRIWGTTDDRVLAYVGYRYIFEENGNPSVFSTYGDAGTDGIWGTTDDVISSITVFTTDCPFDENR